MERQNRFDIIRGLFILIPIFIVGACQESTMGGEREKQTTDPGFEIDLRLMKEERGKQIPSTYRTAWKDARIDLKTKSNRVQSVVELGPFDVGGRTRALIVDRNNRQHILAGAISGGLWESYDGGNSWNPKDIVADNLSITHMDQSELDPNLIFYTTGEVTGNSAGIDGVGVFRSIDGGETFDLLPSSQRNDFFQSWRVACSRVDTNTIYVATRTGLFRSTNLGEDFETIFFGHVSDIALTSDDQIYIGVDEQGVFYSSTGDKDSFIQLGKEDFPERLGRVELDICTLDDSIIYMSFELDADFNDGIGGIFKSSDGGLSWEGLPEPLFYSAFAWYTNTLKVSSLDCNLLFAGSVQAGYYHPTVGWRYLYTGHVDQHVFTEGVDKTKSILVGNDGGVYEIVIDSITGIPLEDSLIDHNEGYAVTQFYAGAISHKGADFMGGTQDNGSWQYFESLHRFVYTNGGDGGYCYLDSSGLVSIVSSQFGNFSKLEYRPRLGTFNRTQLFLGLSALGRQYFIAPLHVSAVKEEMFFVTTREGIAMSEDFGETATPLVQTVPNPYVVKDAYSRGRHVIFYGGADGLLRRIDDLNDHRPSQRGVDLTELMPTPLRTGFIRDIEFDPRYDSVLYVAFSSRSEASRVWKVIDIYSDTPQWESIGDGLPQFLPVNDILFIQEKPYTLIAGTDYGLFTYQEGQWLREDRIPPVVIYQIQLRQSNQLYAFTHGRGIFQAELYLDPLSSLSANADHSFAIYPNPVGRGQEIRWTATDKVDEIRIYHRNGREVMRQTNPSLNQWFAPQHAGLYLVVASNKHHMVARQKLVVQ